jgi:hypothetical protein
LVWLSEAERGLVNGHCLAILLCSLVPHFGRLRKIGSTGGNPCLICLPHGRRSPPEVPGIPCNFAGLSGNLLLAASTVRSKVSSRCATTRLGTLKKGKDRTKGLA